MILLIGQLEDALRERYPHPAPACTEHLYWLYNTATGQFNLHTADRRLVLYVDQGLQHYVLTPHTIKLLEAAMEEAQALYEVWEEELSDTLKEATARIKSKELDK